MTVPIAALQWYRLQCYAWYRFSAIVKDKMLCAYIKMNLLSKEIAPLLNISLRGVEISRYRLRKKLNLAEGENLAEFLQKFSK